MKNSIVMPKGAVISNLKRQEEGAVTGIQRKKLLQRKLI